LKRRGWHTVQRQLASGTNPYIVHGRNTSGFAGFHWNELHYLYDRDGNIVNSKWTDKITSVQISMLPKSTQDLVAIVQIANKRIMEDLAKLETTKPLSMSQPPELDPED
jgi:hypothetical protein